MNQIKLFTFLVFMLANSNAHAWTYYFVADLGVEDNQRLCKYNNGKVYTINANDLCEVSVEDSAAGIGQGVGFLKGAYPDGITKVCVYDVLGQNKALRIQSVGICPLNQNF